MLASEANMPVLARLTEPLPTLARLTQPRNLASEANAAPEPKLARLRMSKLARPSMGILSLAYVKFIIFGILIVGPQPHFQKMQQFFRYCGSSIEVLSR